MPTVAETLRKHGFSIRPDLLDGKPLGECSECKHPDGLSVGEVLESADIADYGNCAYLKDQNIDRLWELAADIRDFDQIDAESLLEVISYDFEYWRRGERGNWDIVTHESGRPGYSILSEELQNWLAGRREEVRGLFYQWAGEKEVPADDGPMVYVSLVWGMSGPVPRKIIKFLYGQYSPLTFKVPECLIEYVNPVEHRNEERFVWVLGDPRKYDKVIPVLGSRPLEKVVACSDKDDEEVLETFKVLLSEMPLEQAIEAARNLR